jgi:hypothetical protein
MDTTNVALLAWEIVGAIVLLIAVIMFLINLPGLLRYIRLKNM